MSSKCPTCGKHCKTESGLKMHRNRVHDTDTRPTNVCEECGEAYPVPEHRAEESRFCSRQCSKEKFRRDPPRAGVSSTDESKNYNYGPEWEDIRKAVLDRDGRRCQGCGMTNTKHKNWYSSGLHVHHTTPAHDFEEKDKAHTAENLVSLCIPCHHKWEGIPVRPSLVDDRDAGAASTSD